MLWRDKHLTHFIVYLASCSSFSEWVNACDIYFNCCELASGSGTHVRGMFEEMPSTLAHEVWWAALFLTANRDSLKCKCGQERDDGHPTRMHILTFKWQTLWQRSLACWQWHHMTSNHPSVSNIPLISCLLSWRLKCCSAYIGGLVGTRVENNNEEITRPVKVPPLLGQVTYCSEAHIFFVPQTSTWHNLINARINIYRKWQHLNGTLKCILSAYYTCLISICCYTLK